MTKPQQHFIPLYVACLVMGLHLMDSNTMLGLNITPQDQISWTRRWWSEVAVEVLRYTDWQSNHNFESIQSYMLV